MTTEEKFRAAVNVIQSLPKDGSFQPSNEMKLKFYSHYKQATQGPCTQARPGFWDPIGRAKHDGWASLGNMCKEEAMEGYIKLLSQIVETMNLSADVETFMEVLGPFYEYVEDKISPAKEKAGVAEQVNSSYNGYNDPANQQVDEMLGRYLDSNSNNTSRVPRTVSSIDVGSVTLDTRKTDMNHNCFSSSPPKIADMREEVEDEEEEADDVDDDDDGDVDELLEELVVAAGQEIKSASSLLKEIQKNLDGDEENTYHLRMGTRVSQMDTTIDEEEEGQEEEESRTDDTVIHNIVEQDESDEEEIFEDSVEHTLEQQSGSSGSKQGTPGGTPGTPGGTPGTPASQHPSTNPSVRSSVQGRRLIREVVTRDGSVESYYLGDPRDMDTPPLPPLPSTSGAPLPPGVHSAPLAPSSSFTSTPVYPEEELVVYSSGDSQPSRILMRPLDSNHDGNRNRFSEALVQRLEGDVRLVNSNLARLTSRLEMMTSNLEHMTARLGSIETNFEQVHTRINTVEYLLQVLLSREESRIVSKSSLATFSALTCVALVIAKVFATRKN